MEAALVAMGLMVDSDAPQPASIGAPRAAGVAGAAVANSGRLPSRQPLRILTSSPSTALTGGSSAAVSFSSTAAVHSHLAGRHRKQVTAPSSGSSAQHYQQCPHHPHHSRVPSHHAPAADDPFSIRVLQKLTLRTEELDLASALSSPPPLVGLMLPQQMALSQAIAAEEAHALMQQQAQQHTRLTPSPLAPVSAQRFHDSVNASTSSRASERIGATTACAMSSASTPPPRSRSNNNPNDSHTSVVAGGAAAVLDAATVGAVTAAPVALVVDGRSQSDLSSLHAEAARLKAWCRALYDNYLRKHALYEVHIADELSNELRQQIGLLEAWEPSPPSATTVAGAGGLGFVQWCALPSPPPFALSALYSVTRRSVFTLLEQDSFRRFQTTPAFAQLLLEAEEAAAQGMQRPLPDEQTALEAVQMQQQQCSSHGGTGSSGLLSGSVVTVGNGAMTTTNFAATSASASAFSSTPTPVMAFSPRSQLSPLSPTPRVLVNASAATGSQTFSSTASSADSPLLLTRRPSVAPLLPQQPLLPSNPIPPLSGIRGAPGAVTLAAAASTSDAAAASTSVRVFGADGYVAHHTLPVSSPSPDAHFVFVPTPQVDAQNALAVSEMPPARTEQM
jgi:hypothetical protein